jgi:phosphoribosylaminoimidazolecarboxamide formyltransferase/IMP cyclohydrolase
MTKIQRALISVSDKTGIVEFAKSLAKHKIQILSTGGTAKTLKEAGVIVTDVSKHTEFPEILDGRVKTLHPKIHAGILSVRDNDKHNIALETQNISNIDMVVVNLYPFAETVKKGADYDECIENIDIGGPAMVRSCAKNHKYTTIVTNPNQYDLVLQEINYNMGETTYEMRKSLAIEAFSHTAEYDLNIANWFSKQNGQKIPTKIFNVANLKNELRYGENPHQKAVLYSFDNDNIGIIGAKKLQGKELSYNNINDADSAFEIVYEYDEPACVIIKHANPCGIAIGDDAKDAWEKALSCDPVSAFGGIVAFNCEVKEDLVQALGDIFLEVIVAPSFSEEFLNSVKLRQNLRLLETGVVENKKQDSNMIKYISGGLLIQSKDNAKISKDDCRVVTKTQPTEQQWNDLMFAWKSVKNVKSNAIVYAKNGKSIGIGAGQTSRVDSAVIGAKKIKSFFDAKQDTKGIVVASDAFFPFADGLQVCIDAGISAVIQPGGSVNDEEVIKCADEAGIAMIFTGMRHFKH